MPDSFEFGLCNAILQCICSCFGFGFLGFNPNWAQILFYDVLTVAMGRG